VIMIPAGKMPFFPIFFRWASISSKISPSLAETISSNLILFVVVFFGYSFRVPIKVISYYDTLNKVDSLNLVKIIDQSLGHHTFFVEKFISAYWSHISLLYLLSL
jgi:hypothetical protein